MTRFSPLQSLLRSCATSGVLMAAGDAVSQTIKQTIVENKASTDFKLNLTEIGEFGLLGCTIHGPLFHFGQIQLDKTFGQARTVRSALLKTLAGQTTLFPLWLSCFLVSQGLFSGLSLDNSVERLKTLLPKTASTGFVFWMPITFANFLFIPPSARMLFMNCTAICWNSYLSLISRAKPNTAS